MTVRQPVPPTGRVDIWLLAGSEEPDGLAAIRLDGEEEARAARMATGELRMQVRRRRRFLRAVLARYLGVAAEVVPLGTDPGGKPVLVSDTRLHFNLSHSGDVSVLAVGSDPLGVDVERRKSFDRLTELVAYACSPRERAFIAAAPDATAAFLDRWVVKEAILKCRGSGLVDDLTAVDPGPVSQSPTCWNGLTVRSLRPLPEVSCPPDLHFALSVTGHLSHIAWHRLGYEWSAARFTGRCHRRQSISIRPDV